MSLYKQVPAERLGGWSGDFNFEPQIERIKQIFAYG